MSLVNWKNGRIITGMLFIFQFNSFGQDYNGLVISEIMADPIPVVGLPAVEYVELYNRSGQTVFLKNWKLAIATRTAIFPDSVILPGQYIILCNKIDAGSFAGFGNVIPLSTFSLPNDGGTISLYQPGNSLVFSITYENSWWQTDKGSGGYAIEMIDTDNPCGEQNNWTISEDSRGGTPAKVNSVKKNNPDIEPPVIQRIDITSPTELRIIVNEKLDSLVAISSGFIELPGRKIVKRKLESPQFHNLELRWIFHFWQKKPTIYQSEIFQIAPEIFCVKRILQ